MPALLGHAAGTAAGAVRVPPVSRRGSHGARFIEPPGGNPWSVSSIPLPGCCNSCYEPVSQRQKSVLFEGPNLRYPQLGEDTAVFHVREYCRWDARGYDEVWVKAAPGRVAKFPGSFVLEAAAELLALDSDTEEVATVTVHLVGGAYDGASLQVPRTCEDLSYNEPVPQPWAPERAAWYKHAADCRCSAPGEAAMPEGDHTFRPEPDFGV